MVADVHNLNILPLFNVSALFCLVASVSTTSATLEPLWASFINYITDVALFHSLNYLKTILSTIIDGNIFIKT